ncbi:MAG TPA: hypothetical protein VM890_00480 [Longimicrobium sp.]|jgi:hypothetical protein|nr:hypothetical protein [Longimicrobium sp.]
MRAFAAFAAAALLAAVPARAQQTHPAHAHDEAAPHRDPPDARMTIRSLAMEQEKYRFLNHRYARTLAEMPFVADSGVVLTFHPSGPEGYSAVAWFNGRECAIFRGNARPPRPYVTEVSKVECRSVAAPSR